MKHILSISYKGTHFNGWQRQNNTPNTIQQVIEDNLSKLFGKEVKIQGCGRTDVGVHARNYIFDFEVEEDRYEEELLRFKLNRMLPEDIAIQKVIKTDQAFHSRYDAVKRQYRYYFHTHLDPFLEDVSTKIDFEIKKDEIKGALDLIKAATDFKAYCKTPDKNKTTLCTIYKAQLVEMDKPGCYYIEIEANRFLRAMIRLLIFDLFELSQGKITLKDIQLKLTSGDRGEFFNQAPPQGLFLERVEFNDWMIEWLT